MIYNFERGTTRYPRLAGLGFGAASPGLVMALQAKTPAASAPATTDGVWGAIDRGSGIYLSVLQQQQQTSLQKAALEAQSKMAAANARSGAYFAASSQAQTTKWLIYGGIAIVGLVALGIAFKKSRK